MEGGWVSGEHRCGVLKLWIDGGPCSNQVRHDMPIHEWQETFEIDGENGPRVGKR